MPSALGAMSFLRAFTTSTARLEDPGASRGNGGCLPSTLLYLAHRIDAFSNRIEHRKKQKRKNLRHENCDRY